MDNITLLIALLTLGVAMFISVFVLVMSLLVSQD
jgi:hypothetical protein